MSFKEPLFRDILVPVKVEAEVGAVPFALALARVTGGKLHFLHVSPEDPGAEREDAVRALMKGLTRRARAQGVSCEGHCRRGAVAPRICEVAEGLPADLVILTRHRDSHHARELEECLERRSSPFHAPCPVMVVPVFQGHSELPVSAAAGSEIAPRS